MLIVVRDDRTTSIRRLSSDLGISRPSVQRILKEEKFHPFKPIYSQFLCDGDSDRRVEFCERMIMRMDNDPAFLRKLTFSDEATFSLNGSVNKHNVHYWCEDNPKVRICNPGRTQTLCVWASISFYGVVAYDIDQRTMTGTRYNDILKEKVVPYFKRHPQSLFQQDGASVHYAQQVRETLNSELSGRWIGRRGAIEWPARSPDLTPCDYWLWSYLRSKVYTPGNIFPTV